MTQTPPILEYDPTLEAITEPSRLVRPRDVPEHCVICFFKEVIEEAAREKNAVVVVENRWEDGPHALYEIAHQGKRLAFWHSPVGAPAAAGLLEEAIAFGCRKFIVCGGCGVLEKGIAVGHLIVVSAALRDEGLSYHYLPPGREVAAHPQGVEALVASLQESGLPYCTGKTWTTDAPYRETRPMVEQRRAEGCIAVEMEAAGLMAVAQFREVILGQVLYGGDDLSGSEWDNRGWQSRSDIRRALFWLAVEACLRL
ncbi:MAG: nucleoside phosphorylase [Anaerolineales bacterium]|nr:nucleoside phosphorylase [Anaerolineales bacterium]